MLRSAGTVSGDATLEAFSFSAQVNVFEFTAYLSPGGKLDRLLTPGRQSAAPVMIANMMLDHCLCDLTFFRLGHH